MGKATIVSVCPFAIREHKPGFAPPSYVVPEVEGEGIAVLHVNDGKHMVRLDSDRPPLEIITPAVVVATSVINDYTEAQMSYTAEQGPGLFAVEGHLDAEAIMSLHPSMVQKARDRMDRWFRALVLLADDEWTKFHQHRMITDKQRRAAEFLKIKREWVNPIPKADTMVECPVCLEQVPNRALMCGKCHVAMPGKEEELRKFFFVTGRKEEAAPSPLPSETAL